ncbi:ATPase [Desulfurococcaceae archaeon MEX13E-LK6-19]|nr:ATPase [Desulfurococcaceae archaeon MEX13E-LK6-19]
MAPPIILNKPARMYKALIVVSKNDRDKTIKVLQKTGLLHIAEKEQKVVDYIKLLDRIRRGLDKIEYMFSYIRGMVIDVKITVNDIIETDIEKILNDVDDMYEKIRFLEDSIRRLREKINTLQNLHTMLSLLPRNLSLDYISFDGKYVSAKLIYGPISSVNAFLEETRVVVEYKVTHQEHVLAIIIYPKFIEEEVLKNIRLQGITLIQIPTEYMEKYRLIGELVTALVNEAKSLSEKVSETEKQLDNYIKQIIEDLAKYKIILENTYKKIEAITNTVPRKYLTLIEGWVPKKYVDKLYSALGSHGIKCYIDLKEPSAVDEPPSLLDNPPVINYYEPIVKFLGVPRYNEWDPTPIISYSFALFYGLMIGDMGYAIALILITFLLLDKLAGYSESIDYIKFKKSFIVSNIVGFAVGLISGTFLGDVSDRLGFRPALTSLFGGISAIFTDPLMFLVASIIIGLIHVNIAHIIALIKFIKNKSVGEILSETGLFVSEIFGIPYIMYKMLHVSLPFINDYNASLFLYGALVGVLMIIVGMIKSMGGLGLLMWIFNITGLLGDVLSYSRIAGVGLATIYLATSFNTMASMAYNGLVSMMHGNPVGVALGIVVALLIAIFGHFINTALSAIGAFIHSLRLCFVEFLTKFYEGTGYPFEPLKVVIRRKLVIE